MAPSPAEGAAYGVVQGLTEFLPISSSAHLVLLPWLFGWSDPGLAFDVALHLGTLFAVAWYFGGDWIRLGRAALVDRGGQDAQLFWKVALASVPAALAGLALEETAETAFREPRLIAASLVGFGVLLWWSDRRPQARGGEGAVGWKDAIWIGAAQALAIVPGVSRSGVTITAARFLEIDRETAARFSFLMSAPIVTAAALVKADEFSAVAADPGALVAVVVSAVVGFAAIAGLLRYVRTSTYAPFVVYRLVLAALIIAVR